MLTPECMYVYMAVKYMPQMQLKTRLLGSVADQYNNIVNNYMRK